MTTVEIPRELLNILFLKHQLIKPDCKQFSNRATDEPIFKHGSSKRPDQQTIQRQGSSLPSLLEATPAPPSHQNLISLPPPPSTALTARAPQGSASEVRTPGGLEPEPLRTLLCSDEITELQISHV